MHLKRYAYITKQPHKARQVLPLPSLPMSQAPNPATPNQSYFAMFLYRFRAIKKARQIQRANVTFCCVLGYAENVSSVGC